MGKDKELNEWYELFVIDKFEGGTYTINSFGTLKQAREMAERLISKGLYSEEELGIDKWTANYVRGFPEPIKEFKIKE